MGSASDLGLMLAGAGVGAVSGALIFGMIGARFSKRVLMVLFFALLSVPTLVLVAEPPRASFNRGHVCCRVGKRRTQSAGDHAAAREITAPEMRARILGAVTAIVLVASPIGALLGGSLVGGLRRDVSHRRDKHPLADCDYLARLSTCPCRIGRAQN